MDIIVFAEVMFDKYTSGENPYHIDFIMKKAKPLFEFFYFRELSLICNKCIMVGMLF